MVRQDSAREKRVRRPYTKEFKVEAVRLVTEGGRRASEVARELGIDANQLYAWKAQLKADSENAFPGKGNVSADQEELVRLRREVVRLKQDLDFLKKTAAYFAREQK